MTINQGTQLWLPKLVGRAYDDLMDPTLDHDNKMPRIHGLMATVLILHCGGALAGSIRTALMGIAGERIVARLRTTLYAQLLQQEIGFFDATQSGELISRLGSDTTVVKQAIASSWAEVVLGMVKLGIAIGLMVSISPSLASLTVTSTVVIFVLCIPFGRLLGKLSKEFQDKLGQAQSWPTEILGAMRTVQSFVAEEKEAHRYASLIGTNLAVCSCFFGRTSSGRNRNGPNETATTTFSIGYQQSLVRSIFMFVIFGGGFAAMYGSLWYGFTLVHHGHISLGDLTAFQSYIFQIGGILAHMSSSISNCLEALGTSQRIFALLDRTPQIPSSAPPPPQQQQQQQDDEGNNHDRQVTADNNNTANGSHDVEQASKWSGKLQGNIAMEHVTFTYPSRPDVPVLQDFSLEIGQGQTTAIVGPSGAGKSTVIALLERFYDVQKGCIRLDGRDIRDLDLKTLRRQIGLVQQEPTLFGLSVRDNITYGVDLHAVAAPTDDQIWEACRTANAADFIANFPHGLDELIGERGTKLSGGQKQRIAIARAILLNPAILLLDEATSALDAESEYLVQQAMDAASQGRTVIVVAHRLSTIQKADQIVVLEQYCVQDVGTHPQLLERSETYRNLIARQSMGTIE